MVQAGWALPLLQLPQLLWEGGLAGPPPPPAVNCAQGLAVLAPARSPAHPPLAVPGAQPYLPRPVAQAHLCGGAHPTRPHTETLSKRAEVPGRPCSSLPVWSRSSRLSAQPRPEQFSPPGCPLLARGLCGRCRAMASLPGAGRPRHLHGHAQGSVAWRLGLGEGTGEVGGRLVSPSPGREPWLWSGGSR